MPPSRKPPRYQRAVADLRVHPRPNAGLLWHFSCYRGTRLTIDMLPGARKECLCGTVHEFADQGTRMV